ncbi:MAG: family 16 glycosylhydrolase [Ignavibacteriales bacterium]|nr:family 16 glycosylhydrolase [Ignavibacteriales bacterium]MCB9208749.1 family 16 glycosylhydrolase [Ignavibacteriales bacterium]MCB9218333.1 family 16 glycosylhydrolase [Ignavibacteriales bacterium]MCB9260629.1 family 16 glycosylhydrolase [Ignavibacteriales bacterium]
MIESQKAVLILFCILLFSSCVENETLNTINLDRDWLFHPDEKNIGITEKWFASDFDDSNWDTLKAGNRWENQGYPNLDGFAWYRKKVKIPIEWNGKKVWIKFSGVNDSYNLFVNGKKVASVGEANISYASKSSFSEISKFLNADEFNLIVVQVNDWGNSGGLWQEPNILTIDENQTKNLFRPISKVLFNPINEGYKLYWEDDFNGTTLDSTKWEVRGVGPRATGFVSAKAVKVKEGNLELYAIEKDDSILVGAVGTQKHFMTTYGYFECRAQLQKSKGNWAAFWIQSPGIAKGEDPGKFGTEIDIFEYFKKNGDNVISHNLHWAYGPNQQTIGGLQSMVDGVNEGFHTFALEWTPEKYAFFIDGLKYYEVTKAISHTDEYIIFSMELPHKIEDLAESVFPDVFKIDYVRVYKKENY